MDICVCGFMFRVEGSLKANLGAKSLPQACQTGSKAITVTCRIFIPYKNKNYFGHVLQKVLFFFLKGDQVLAAHQPNIKVQQTERTKMFALILPSR